jgi:hypothetical protein
MKSLRASATFFIVVFAIGLNIAYAQNEDGKKSKSSKLISISYDKKKQIRTVRIKRSSITRLAQEKDNAPNFPLHQMDLDMVVTQKGENPSAPVEAVVINFYPVAGNYIFMRPAQVIAVIDRNAEGEDRAIPLGMSDYKSMAPKFNTVYEEVLSVTVPLEVLIRMAKANSLELFVGPVGYQLTNNQLGAIKEVAASFPAQ